jgi:hypothetical protein
MVPVVRRLPVAGAFGGRRRAMRKRRILLVLAALAGLAGLAWIAFIWTLPKRPEVSLTTMVRLKRGMSEADVVAVLGPPAADLTARPPAIAGDILSPWAP